MLFANHRYLTTQVFELTKSTLKIYQKKFFNSIEYEISLEHITHKKIIETKFNDGLFITGLFFFLFGLLFQLGPNDELTLIFVAIAVIFALTAIMGRKKIITIPTYTGNNIQLYFNSKNKQEVMDFADATIAAANQFLRNKYMKIDRALPVAPQIEGLQFLRDREIISEETFESLKNQLLGRSSETRIGFGR